MLLKKKKIWRFVVGLIVKSLMLLTMILGVITSHTDHPDSAAGFVVLSLILLFAVLEHIFNPRNELTGEYKIF